MQFNLSQKLEPALKLSLEMALAPKMLAMLKILNLPYHELLETIQKESEENVMLEVENQETLLATIQYINTNKTIKKEADFSALPGMANIGNDQKTLHQSLLDQLDLESLTPQHKKIAEQLIGEINADGYLLNYPAVRENIEKQLGISRPTIDKILKTIQEFEPDGVGARNLKECLLIQVRSHNFENHVLQEIIEGAISKHLDDLAEGRIEKIAASLAIREEGVKQIMHFIKNNLNPKPGSVFGKEEIHIVPSFSLVETNGRWQALNLEERYGPKLKLSPDYEKMLSQTKDEATRTYLKEKMEKAKALIDSIKKRQDTQNKIANKIVAEQSLFFEKGKNWIKPLLQKNIAEEIGVHPSTVSRALASKYLQTPKGIYNLKSLCQRSWLGVPKTRLKEIIEEIICAAGQNQNISDEKIRAKLAEQGIVASRRTIAEYRRQLNIPSSKERSKNVQNT